MTTATVTEAAMRGAVYAELARTLAYPRETPDLVALAAVVLDDPEAEALRGALVRERPGDPAALRRAHTRIFPPVESRDCPSYETAYRGRDVFQQAHVMADVAGFYRAHGLTIGGRHRDRPDAIGPELEFMGFLAWKEAAALERGDTAMVDACRHAQTLFLTDHLGCWGPEYGSRMAVAAEHPFYRALGSFVAAWVEADMGRLDVTPGAVADLPMPSIPMTLDGDGEDSCG